MITSQIKSQVDKVWDTFWSGGISNPFIVVEKNTSTSTKTSIFGTTLKDERYQARRSEGSFYGVFI